MMTKSKLYLFGLDFGFWPHFCSETSHGQHCAYGPNFGTWPGFSLQLISQINRIFQNDRAESAPCVLKNPILLQSLIE